MHKSGINNNILIIICVFICLFANFVVYLQKTNKND